MTALRDCSINIYVKFFFKFPAGVVEWVLRDDNKTLEDCKNYLNNHFEGMYADEHDFISWELFGEIYTCEQMNASISDYKAHGYHFVQLGDQVAVFSA